MSDTARPKSSGDKLSSAEVNRELPIAMTAGTPIASTPRAVYVKNADGYVYEAVSTPVAENMLAFVGFAMDIAGASGSAVAVQTAGIVGGFSGLTIGSRYYLTDTPGVIGTAVGSYVAQVGIAISATELLIGSAEVPQFLSGDTLMLISDTERIRDGSTSSGTYQKLKEFLIGKGGTFKIKFSMKTSNATDTQYARIYRNGVAVGTEQSDASGNYTTHTEVISGWKAGDLLQLYAKATNPYDCLVEEFRIYVKHYRGGNLTVDQNG